MIIRGVININRLAISYYCCFEKWKIINNKFLYIIIVYSWSAL